MRKKVLIISTSLRNRSNSEILAREAARGVKAAGNEVKYVSLKDKEIRYCLGCMKCIKSEQCVQKDDVAPILTDMKEADAIIFVSPIYYYSISGQLKTLLDRTLPFYRRPYLFRDIYLITVSADTAEDTAKRAIVTLGGWIDCFDKARFAGGFNAGGLNDANAIEEHSEWLPRAFELGKQI